MADDQCFYGSVSTNDRRKRTHDHISTDHTRDQPRWISHLTNSLSNPTSSSSANEVHDRPQIPRFLGDGLDFRTPVMSEPAAVNIIDLTDEPDSPRHAPARPSNANSPRASTRASRLRRFSRNVIDLEDEHEGEGEEDEIEQFELDDETQRAFNDAMGDFENASTLSNSSGEVEFVSENSIRTVTPPVPGLMGLSAWHARLPIPRIPPDWNNSPLLRNFFHSNDQISLDLDAEPLERVQYPGSNHRHHPPMRFAHRRGNDGLFLNFNSSSRMPGDLDFETAAFAVHHHSSTAPPLPVYDPPPPPRSGFTRSAAEEDIIICPNCKEELGIGDTEIKRQVWVVKKCGHVYCGLCTMYRHKTKVAAKIKAQSNSRTAPFSHCVVEGCGKTSLSGAKCWMQLYI